MQHTWTTQLLDLQEKDLRIFKLRGQVAAVPTEKSQAQALCEQEKEKLQTARQRVVEIEKGIKKLEMEAESWREKQRNFASKSTMIRDNDEYRAALQQIEQCRKKISDCEDRELDLMAELEAARSRLEEEKRILADVETRTRQTLEDLDLRARNCQAQIDRLTEQRSAVAAEIPGDVMKRYQRMIDNSAGRPVLVPVGRANICGGCHMNVPAQDRVHAAGGQLVGCPNCGAMLYYDEDMA